MARHYSILRFVMLSVLFELKNVACNPSTGQQPEDTCVYSFQVPRQDSHAACSDSASLDQQLLKTMVLSLQRQVTQLQEERLHNTGNDSQPTGARNIRQCSYSAINEQKENGEIRTCSFHKTTDDTVLRVAWNGDVRLKTPGPPACRRWFFTINGQECLHPARIDIQRYEQNPANDVHRPAYLEGLCSNIGAGDVRVTFNVGDCLSMSGYQTGDAYTGWASTSRIVVEELTAQQPNLVQ